MIPKNFSRRDFAATGLVLGAPPVLGLLDASAAESATASIRIVVGPSKHPPGTHEVAATGRLLQSCLTQALHAQQVTDCRVEVMEEWPDNASVLDKTLSFVFVGDFFPPMRMQETERIMANLEQHMQRGCGIVCVHYATGLGAQDVPEDGNHPLLRWMGGYFATRCKHHQSIARVFEKATIVPAALDHDVLRGWKTFTLHDEPYINNYFGSHGPDSHVAILATASLPPENPKPEAVGWAVERADTGRGIGIVMPHFFKNWLDKDLRKFILNAVFWSAKQRIPVQGIETQLDDLAQFRPDSVEPIVKAAKS